MLYSPGPGTNLLGSLKRGAFEVRDNETLFVLFCKSFKGNIETALGPEPGFIKPFSVFLGYLLSEPFLEPTLERDESLSF